MKDRITVTSQILANMMASPIRSSFTWRSGTGFGSSIRPRKPRTAVSVERAMSGQKAAADDSVVTVTSRTASLSQSSSSSRRNQARRKKASPRGRQVRFLFDASDKVEAVTAAEGPERVCYTEEEWDRCFTNSAALHEARKLAVRRAVLYAQRNPLYVEALRSLLVTPLELEPAPSIKQATAKRESHRSSRDDEELMRIDLCLSPIDDSDRIRMIGECEERGLEHVMARSAMFIRHRKYVVSSVVQRYDQLGRVGRAGDTASSSCPAKVLDARAEILARYCSSLSTGNRDMAILLARADALQAQRIYEDER